MADAEAEWQVGYGVDGRPVVRYQRGERDGRPWADRLEVLDPGADPAVPARYVLAELPGWVVSGPVPLGEELMRHGATALRHGHTMHRPLTGEPPAGGWASWAEAPVRDGFHLVPCDREAGELVRASVGAFGPGHPDHRPGELDDEQTAVRRLDELLSGEVIGRLLPTSALVVDGADRVVAGAVLTDWDGLPWIAHVFRDPDLGYPGLGRGLLCRVLADTAARGAAQIGLAVTEGNRARRLYESLGFTVTRSTLTVVVP
ncbi:GNAT family N-acetyltransferase [Kitasatospora sp. NBC_00458]|uniref:GNAT family N-acetyltransferase n=1 Tax=Kitasatospora sp. NBC_00458 TaxID=2903568 RepID=UPI002E19DA17